MPRAPNFVAGVIDVRGDVIPVVNLKKRFALSDTEVGEDGRIVIVEVGEQIVGFLVDGVSEVTRLAAGEEAPSYADLLQSLRETAQSAGSCQGALSPTDSSGRA